MRRDYRLYELSESEFEELVVKICVKWLGEGVTPFAPGRDGGRDGKFNGKAECFPSTTQPLEGHVVLQAKHVAVFDKSCSDKDFERLLKKEHAKIKRLAKKGLCDHYIVFTNRRYTGGADEKLIAGLMALGVKSAHIIGIERLNTALDDMQQLREWLPNRKDTIPFRFEPDDLVEVIGAVHDYADDSVMSAFNSARDFEKLKLREEKNKINGLSDDYYNQIMVNYSFPHFARIDHFLRNPRNTEIAALYHDSADELKQKILAAGPHFETFDNVFAFLIEEIQKKRVALKGKRRMISVMLHYMYANCDIGSKKLPTTPITDNAHA